MLSSNFNQLLTSNDIVVFSLYRGAWCPFCVQYLKALNKAHEELARNDLSIYGVCTQGEKNKKLQKKLNLGFKILDDEERFFHHQYKVPLGDKPWHQRYLQPAVFIFKNKELIYSWIQDPKLINFQGAINRLSVKDVCAEISKL